MKLQNKKTKEIRELSVDIDRPDNGIRVYADDGINYRMYNTLAELNAEWEDYEEPKKYWGIDYSSCRIGGIEEFSFDNDNIDKFNKEIGNYFETREEAEKVIEKLKAWKRLKDKGFQFESWFGGSKDISFWLDTEIDEDIAKDLDLLFGGEE